MKLWASSALLRISERMAYRGEYLISLITMFVTELVAPLFTFVIYYHTMGFEGWSFFEVILLQGCILTVKGFSFFAFAGIIWNSNLKLQKGEFDIVLLKPRNPLYMFICESFDAEDPAKFIGGLLIIGVALVNLDMGFDGALLMILLLMMGVLVYFSLALFASAFIFTFIRTFRVYELLDILELIAEYPSKIYPKAVKVIFTAALPLFIISTFPVKALMGELSLQMLIAAISTICVVAIALYTWFFTIRRYSSAGG